MQRSILGIMLVLAFGLAIVGCNRSASGGRDSRATEGNLVGAWEFEDETLSLFEDGTGSWDEFGITWKVEKNRLTVSGTVQGIAMTFSYDYILSGSTLTLTDEDGEVTEYTKK